ncbi:MAG: NADH-quinone oxidoreductase subunit M [Actinobacteria bacterium]|nr:NADH-quinone oxidoreductase subunit M [Actinomycetota bacterium]
MTDFPLLTALIFTPAAGALAALAIPRGRDDLQRAVGMTFSVATLGLAGFLLVKFEAGTPAFQFLEHKVWMRDLGVSYTLGVDGISLFMIVLTALLFPVMLLGSASIKKNLKAYTFFLLLLEAGIIGVFTSLDLIVFFVFWEVTLVPMYFLIGGWGYERRIYAAIKFFLYTMAGSALLLVGILTLSFLYAGDHGGQLTFNFLTLAGWDGLAGSTEKLLFLAFFAGFAVKVPLFPFHTWLPDAHTEAPTAGSVVLAAVLLKMGTYGFLRFSMTLFPEATVDLAPVLLVLATIGVIYGALMATVQPDIKRLIAYSSVAHLGFVVLGLFALTTQGMAGGVFTMIAHGLNTGALFLLVGMIYERRHTRQIADLRGLWKVAPRLGGLFLVAAFASVGLPGLSGFVGEFLVLLGAFLTQRPYAVISAVGVILAAVYLLWAYQRAFTGEPEGENAEMTDLNFREMATVVPLVLLSLVLGVYPKPILERVEPSLDVTIGHLEARTDYRRPLTPEVVVEEPETGGAPPVVEEHGSHEGEGE